MSIHNYWVSMLILDRRSSCIFKQISDRFCHYPDVRRVLCHELAHNVWGQHDNNMCSTCHPSWMLANPCQFKELNSKLNRELVYLERAQASRAYYLSEQDIYQPPSPSEVEAETHAYMLGSPSTAPLEGDSRQDMRRRMLEATMNRLRKKKKELETSCGTRSDAFQL